MARTFNPGEFRHRITFLKPPETRDDFGSPAGEWIPHATVRASAEPLIGRELYAAMTAESRVEIKFRTRRIDGVDETMRINWRGADYSIISAVDANAAGVELLCYCRRLR